MLYCLCLHQKFNVGPRGRLPWPILTAKKRSLMEYFGLFKKPEKLNDSEREGQAWTPFRFPFRRRRYESGYLADEDPSMFVDDGSPMVSQEQLDTPTVVDSSPKGKRKCESLSPSMSENERKMSDVEPALKKAKRTHPQDETMSDLESRGGKKRKYQSISPSASEEDTGEAKQEAKKAKTYDLQHPSLTESEEITKTKLPRGMKRKQRSPPPHDSESDEESCGLKSLRKK